MNHLFPSLGTPSSPVGLSAATRLLLDRERRAAESGGSIRPAASGSARVLVVDDLERNRALLSGMVESLGYGVETAADGFEALAKAREGIDLVLLDIMMPGLDGFEVAQRLRAAPFGEELPVIFVTALDSREDRVQAVRAGASDFIAKPVDRTELEVRIVSQLRLKEARDAVKRHQEELEAIVAQRTAALRAAVVEMAAAKRQTDEAHLDTIRRLVLAAELKDQETGHHVVRIGRYTALLARALGLPEDQVAAIGHAATMHDVGKIGIPDAILLKPGSLTPEERRIMQGHAVIGGRILENSSSELLSAGQVIALSHHERWDGTGYPRGLAGEAIPLEGRICAVADVFDALTTDRPYRSAMDPNAALMLMVEGRGTHFDPRLLDLFAAHFAEVLAIWREFQIGADAWHTAAELLEEGQAGN
ncbi:MAG TPA: HD domain-containing phosphohydrolase [Thermoanaerobaculia bacterium]